MKGKKSLVIPGLIIALFISSCSSSQTNYQDDSNKPLNTEEIYYAPLGIWLQPIPDTKSSASDKYYMTAVAHPSSIEELSELGLSST